MTMGLVDEIRIWDGHTLVATTKPRSFLFEGPRVYVPGDSVVGANCRYRVRWSIDV